MHNNADIARHQQMCCQFGEFWGASTWEMEFIGQRSNSFRVCRIKPIPAPFPAVGNALLIE